jgi:hypothetical protein
LRSFAGTIRMVDPEPADSIAGAPILGPAS